MGLRFVYTRSRDGRAVRLPTIINEWVENASLSGGILASRPRSPRDSGYVEICNSRQRAELPVRKKFNKPLVAQSLAGQTPRRYRYASPMTPWATGLRHPKLSCPRMPPRHWSG